MSDKRIEIMHQEKNIQTKTRKTWCKLIRLRSRNKKYARWGYNDNKNGVYQTHKKKLSWVWGDILKKLK